MTASTFPVRDAVINAVSPPGAVVFASAPAANSAPMIAAFPLVDARVKGATPYRLRAFGLAPAFRSSWTVCRSSSSAAQCSAVEP